MDMKTWIRSQWDRVAAGAATLIGALAMLIGYRGVSDALYPGQQIPYVISGGLFGLFLVGLGAALWLSADLRDEWRKLDDMDDKLSELLEHHRRVAAHAQEPDPAREHPNGTEAREPSNGRGRREPVRAR